MRRFFEILFVIAIIIVGIETFRPQAPYPYNASNGYVAGVVSTVFTPSH
ncbi:MAG: hypothetical protein OWQ59_03690 [Alicyclobacillaceae bacterium]|jgi:hypothetical protein|nr:hypothetical protein [Alicyclobacillus sp. SP_1]MCY0887540.1 hypothetical protein [Alicyclobacillaceae bacterium]MCY0895099.1 hypothetical protein [Alicyclobacillaceae bacterium]